MIQIIQKAEEAYVKREFAKLHMKEMRKQIEDEKKDFDEQWTEIEKMIKESQQMKDYIKNQENDKKVQIEQHGVDNLNELKNEERELRKRVTDSMNKVKEYQKALQNIKKETGLNDIEELVNAFEHAEEDNLSLFNYVTELTNEVSALCCTSILDG
jgi:coiled-coil domain-containing protein 63/114